MATETELKLLLEPAALRRLRRHPLVQRLKKARPATRLLRSVYFDTEDFLLRRNEVVLRVRHMGRRRIQTVKTMGKCLGGAWARQEWESEISGDLPELGGLQSGELAFLFQDGARNLGLQPVFTTEVRRTAYLLGEDGWEVELALDEGRLITPRGDAPIVEAEFELKQGEPRHLFRLALALQGETPGRIGMASKAERGFRLTEGAEPQPQKARTPPLSAGQSAAEAFRAIARSCVGQLLVNQECLQQSRAPEAVHQMRVAMRRLRSAINLFKDALATEQTGSVVAELKWLQSVLGPARDADVFMESMLAPLAPLLGGDNGYRSLCAGFDAARQSAYQAAVAALAAPRFTRLLLLLGEWSEGGDWLDDAQQPRQPLLARPIEPLAAEILTRRNRKLRKAARHLASLSDAERHAARIQVKRLRYAMEFFAGLYPERKTKRLLAALAELQDRLGLMNDITVGRRLLHDFAAASGDEESLWAGGVVAGWHASRSPGLLAASERAWRAFDELRRPWET